MKSYNISASQRLGGEKKLSAEQFERPFVGSLFALHALMFMLVAALVPAWITGDSSHYIELAQNLTRGRFGVFTPNGFEPEGIRSAAYPVFILICDLLPGATELNVVIVQGALYLIAVFLIWKLVGRTFGKGVSNTFLILLLGYPFIAYSSCFVSPEGPCIFLAASAAFVLDSALRKNHDYAGFATLGLLLGLATYFRSNLFPLPFFLALIFLAVHRKNRKAVLLVPLTAFLVMLPQMIYNYQNFRSLRPTTVYSGAETSLWMATWHARLSTDDLLKYRRNEMTPAVASSGMLEQMARLNRKIGVREDFFPINMAYYDSNATRARVSEEYGKAAVGNIAETPGVYLGSSFINMFRMWFSVYVAYGGFPVLLQYCLLLAGLFVFLFGLAGLGLLFKNPLYQASPFVLVAVGTIVFHSITLCWSHTEARYTIPARLFLTAFAAFALYKCLEFAANAWRKAV